MQNPVLRVFWRIFFVAVTAYGVFSLWSLQAQRYEAAHHTYTSELGNKIANIAAGSLSPWLHAQLSEQQHLNASAQSELLAILHEFLALGDILGVRVFNRYGESLGSAGSVNNLLDDLATVDTPVQVHVSNVMFDAEHIGYVRFVLTQQALDRQQVDAFQRQQGLVLLTLLCAGILGALIMRWYYLAQRRAAKGHDVASDTDIAAR